MLIQQRQSNAPSWPSFWDVSVGGGVAHTESSQIAAGREIREELGLDIDFSGCAPAVTVTFSEGFDDYYITHLDIGAEELHLQPEEVQDARWATKDEILLLIEEGCFIPYRKSFIDFLFFLSTHAGTHDT
jgi:isopentenyldiphosphate isomerase